MVITWVRVEDAPRHRVPARLVRTLALHGLEDEPSGQQLVLGPLNHVGRLPATSGQVSAARQQSPVVVPDELARELHQQRAGRVAQIGIRWAIKDGPRQRDKAPALAAGVAFTSSVAPVGHATDLQAANG